MRTLSTCGRCGGTIERRPGSVAGWGHITETARNADGHLPDPDDGYATTGADEHEEEPEEEICTCLSYAAGGDGPEVDCPIHGDLDPSEVSPVAPAKPLLVEGSYADPWLDPDAAAAATPPPF